MTDTRLSNFCLKQLLRKLSFLNGNSGIDISNSLTKHWAFEGKSRFLRSTETSVMISSHVDSIGKLAERLKAKQQPSRKKHIPNHSNALVDGDHQEIAK